MTTLGELNHGLRPSHYAGEEVLRARDHSYGIITYDSQNEPAKRFPVLSLISRIFLNV